MKSSRIFSATVVVFALFYAYVAWAQTPAYGDVPAQQSSPLYKVTLVARTTKAINYGHRAGSTMIGFRGTVLMPEAKGEARVQSKASAVKISAKFEKMQPPWQYGPEFLTYVLWAVSPEGRATNLGELMLEGNKSKADVTTTLQAFALLVTAEPYFAVMQPSDVVVLENQVRSDTVGSISEVEAKYDLMERGQYSSVSANAEALRLQPGVPLALYEARNAVRIARQLGADRYASDSMQKAIYSLSTAEVYQKQKANKKLVEMAAREAVQTAEDARAITAKRRNEERLAQERAAAAERERLAKATVEDAIRRKQEAEAAQAAAERAKLEAQLAAERAARERLEAEQARSAMLAEAQRARDAADQANRDRAAAEVARSTALAQQQQAQADAERARLQAQQAEAARQRAEAEKAELRTRLMNQLNSILQTRDSVRGLIVNMSDVLFDTGRYTLKAGAREKLAKISGIVLAYPGLSLQVEGHTDSVGSDDYNQQLSEYRANAVRGFLVQQGVPAAAISARGFGKTQPIATNDTPEGRQQNRRVELVVSGDSIGTTVANSAQAGAAQDTPQQH